jgi:hypothetical protein
MDERLNKILFFIGWLLSPFTWWNDALVNIPLSYISANFLALFIRLPFVWLVIGSYWLTNILGISLLYLSGKELLAARNNRIKNIISMALSITLYSLIVFLLNKLGVLPPLKMVFKN